MSTGKLHFKILICPFFPGNLTWKYSPELSLRDHSKIVHFPLLLCILPSFSWNKGISRFCFWLLPTSPFISPAPDVLTPVLSLVAPADNSVVRSNAFQRDLHFNWSLSHLEALSLDHQCTVRTQLACPVFKRQVMTTKSIEETCKKKKKIKFPDSEKTQELATLDLFSNTTISWNCGEAVCSTRFWGLQRTTVPTTPYRILDTEE